VWEMQDLVQEVTCTLCNKVCKSPRGLSLHKRAAHRAEFLAQQVEAGGLAAHKGRIWAREDAEVLSMLLRDEKGKRGILAKACALLPEHTKKTGQIQTDSLTGLPVRLSYMTLRMGMET